VRLAPRPRKKHRLLRKGPPVFPGGVVGCAAACDQRYPGAWEFNEWQDCFDRCTTLYGGGAAPGARPGSYDRYGIGAMLQRRRFEVGRCYAARYGGRY